MEKDTTEGWRIVCWLTYEYVIIYGTYIYRCYIHTYIIYIYSAMKTISSLSQIVKSLMDYFIYEQGCLHGASIALLMSNDLFILFSFFSSTNRMFVTCCWNDTYTSLWIDNNYIYSPTIYISTMRWLAAFHHAHIISSRIPESWWATYFFIYCI